MLEGHFSRHLRPGDPYPDILFLVVSENCQKDFAKNKDFFPVQTLKTLRKEGKNAQKAKEFLAKAKMKEFQKNKEKKIRVASQEMESRKHRCIFIS